MRKLFLSLAIALAGAGIAFGRCPLSFSGSDRASVGVFVQDIESGHVTAEYNQDLLLTPASVMKSVTTAAALTVKGGDYRWTTRVVAVGKVADGVLQGNLIVFGSGDPSLGSKQFSEEMPAFVPAVKQAAANLGITSVAGRVLQGPTWPDLGPVPSWELEDIPGIDGAGFYTLNYKDNIFTLSVPSMTATPAIPGLEVINNMGGGSGLRFTRFPGSAEIRVYGSLGKKQKRASLLCSMPNPPRVLISELERAFNAAGKDFTGLKDTLELLNYRSPMLRDVTRSLMVRSDNQMAEATLRLLAPKKGRGSAIKAERETLETIGADLMFARIADGSGLSRHNAISPRQLATVLRVMAANGDYVGSFARVGLDGTVRNFMKDNPGRTNFVLKSGSMTGVVCYCGYRLDPQSKTPTHAIAIMINNAPDSSKARAAIAAYLTSLF